jgi:squalene-hopene/tetraprenyl-beta-curcumene cyclase
MIHLLLTALLGVTATAASGAAGQGLDFNDTIRPAVRWLRSTQDPLTGCYGDGTESTALVLRAFALCPDRYRSTDGPFVRMGLDWLVAAQAEDGAICDAEAAGEAREVQTRVAVQTLMVVPDESTAETIAKAIAFLGADGQDWDTESAGDEREHAEARSNELAAKRDREGWWDGPRGKVIETADAVLELSEYARVLKGPAGEPAPVAELPVFDPADRQRTLVSMRYGGKFLNKLADEEGRFGMPGHPDAGITAMALAALQTLPEPRPDDVQKTIDSGIAWLITLQRADGSIHDGKLANYITSASIMALARTGGHAEVIAKAAQFLQGLQLDEGEGYSEGDVYYGGIGYGSTERPDLSNLQMALEALADSGLEEGAPTYQKALRFLERTQNRSESNDVRIVDGNIVITAGDDGGASYRPGDSKAGFVELGDGTKVPRSYGSMTYALLKCFVFAGLSKDDPRLQAAWEWCSTHYTLDVNPGFEHATDPAAAYQGLYYYFNTMARALDAMGEETIVDAAGEGHAWRKEICGRIVSMQSKIDGSWINHNSPRWYEGNPLLATAYALLTLDAAMPAQE